MGPNGIKVKTKKPEHFILHTHDTYSSSGMSLCVVLFLTLISKSSQFSNFQMSLSTCNQAVGQYKWATFWVSFSAFYTTFYQGNYWKTNSKEQPNPLLQVDSRLHLVPDSLTVLNDEHQASTTSLLSISKSVCLERPMPLPTACAQTGEERDSRRSGDFSWFALVRVIVC